jgi:phosphoserine phosphatase RsbU/P
VAPLAPFLGSAIIPSMPWSNGSRGNSSVRRFKKLGQGYHQAAGRVTSFWQSFTEDLAVGQLWDEFQADAEAGYHFYAQEVDWTSFARQRKWQRRLSATRALSWALLRKLSPARRMFLVLILAFLLFTLVRGESGPATVIVTLALLLLLALELADRVTMKRDLEIAREIQCWLVPATPPSVAGIDLAFATRPANTVAGDYYDAFLRDQPGGNGRLFLVVADVVGKSIPAALLMATIQASLRSLAASPLCLGELVLGLNRYACANSLAGTRFTTAFLAEWDTVRNTLTYINAGHNPPLLKRCSGVVERLEAGGLPLGILSAGRYQQEQLVLRSGDLLVVFTDGVIEAENEAQAEFGETRLLECVTTMHPASAAEAQRSLMASVDAFVGSARQHDDITSLLLLVR